MSSLFSMKNVLIKLVDDYIGDSIVEVHWWHKRSKQSASTRTITGGYLEGEMFELGLEVLPGIQKVENRGDRHFCQREMWLNSKRMGLLSGKLSLQQAV